MPRKEIAAIGVDVGGTKIAAGLVNGHGEILAREREWIEKGTGDGLIPAGQIGAMASKLRDAALHKGLRVAGCGVAVPAFVDRAAGKVIWAPNIEGWRDFPLGRFLEDWTGLPVMLDYDGSAAVLGEQWVGAACGASDAILLIIGTGIGAGFIFNGRVYRGATGLAGGVGWNCLESEAVEDPFFRAGGFFETVAAGPGIARKFCLERSLIEGEGDEANIPGDEWDVAGSPGDGEEGAGAPGGGRSEASRAYRGRGGDVTAEDVFALASKGDPVALGVVREAVRYIGVAAANLISALNPEVVVLGGGVGCHLGPYLEEIHQVINWTAQPQAMNVAKVVTAALGDDGGMIGSARDVLESIC